MGAAGASGAPARGRRTLTAKDWWQVVIVAGVGSVIEWWDFFIFAQLDGVFQKAFFSGSEALYWVVFGISMAARPVGAVLFGHLGDTVGRSKTLVLSLICMALGTAAIGCLPTNDVGAYTAGVAAPVLLGLFRALQGLALGGEFGTAIVYVSEVVGTRRRVLWTAALQVSTNVGLLLAVALIMVLESTVSSYNMLIWGWRIPFFLSFLSGLLGFWLRRGMPEPRAFLQAAAKQQRAEAQLASQRQLAQLEEGGGGGEAEGAWAVGGGSGKSGREAVGAACPSEDKSVGGAADGKESPSSECREGSDEGLEDEEPFERAMSAGKSGEAQHSLQPDIPSSKVPLFRALRNNWVGMVLEIMYIAWATAAFHATTTWLPSQLRLGGMDTRVSQGILLASMVPSTIGILAIGYAMDRGVPAMSLNIGVVTIGAGAAFGAYWGAFQSTLAAWLVLPAFMTLVGASIPLVGAPLTRLFHPLERISGYSVGYNIAVGTIGGFSPFLLNYLRDSSSAAIKPFVGPFYLLVVAGVSVIGSLLLCKYAPRLNKRFVGHIE